MNHFFDSKIFQQLVLKTQESFFCSCGKHFYEIYFSTSEETLSNLLLVILDHYQFWLNLKDRKQLLKAFKAQNWGPKSTLWVETLREILFGKGAKENELCLGVR